MMLIITASHSLSRVIIDKKISEAYCKRSFETSNFLVSSLNNIKNPVKTIILINGPGSFTGFRIAHSFAQSLSIFYSCPIKMISLFELMRYINPNLVTVIPTKINIYYEIKSKIIKMDNITEINDLLDDGLQFLSDITCKDDFDKFDIDSSKITFIDSTKMLSQGDINLEPLNFDDNPLYFT